ncbi:MAG: HAMP domain-containing sensor histidine kinase, partial [Campylobacterota bacterium]|nr:HAMP domain-containing sensor histidine kinase [Campylobacterota bacterium]
MGEMIGNIAHQWRQPLSVISTLSTGVKFQKEFSTLSDEDLINDMDLINSNAQYLSKTIDDFRNFIKGDRRKKRFNLCEDIDSFLRIIQGSATSSNIKLVFDLRKDIQINGYPNELIQCFINIFNNSKDALQNVEEDNRFVFITSKTIENNVIITFKDNAKGIPQDIISKIFDPYFTTKHQSQGTGLGLHMTYKLIVDGMEGTIEARNVTYTHEDLEYTGAEMTITLPLD